MQLLGLFGSAVAAQQAHLLRQVVHLGANGIALRADIAGTFVERAGSVELIEQVGLAAAGHGRTDVLGLGTKQANVDHRVERLLADTR